MDIATLVGAGLGIIALLFLLSGIRIVKEYERGVIFRLGRLVGARGPGLFYVIPIIESMVVVDLRTITYDVPKQEVLTKDNVPVSVNAVVYFRVVDPEKAVTEVRDFQYATAQLAQTTLRSVIGQVELDELLTEREKINMHLQEILDEATNPWGIKVTAVEIKDVEIPEEMRKIMAMQAEAEREKRAKIIKAEGELQAAQKLLEASKIIEGSKIAPLLRVLQTLSEIGMINNTTIVLPIPIEILEYFKRKN
jgi:regulator of protease activity HflC (stomatin/prohibitin superfamily)